MTAYNARDLSYCEAVLDPKSVYIAEDGGVISGRERVLRTFGRIFSAESAAAHRDLGPRRGPARGDAGWATFRLDAHRGSGLPARSVTSGAVRPVAAPDGDPMLIRARCARTAHASGRHRRLALAQPFAALTAARP